MYDFRSFPLSRYFIGPAKLTPMTLNGVDCSVLTFGNGPVGGVCAGTALNFLHSNNEKSLSL